MLSHSIYASKAAMLDMYKTKVRTYTVRTQSIQQVIELNRAALF